MRIDATPHMALAVCACGWRYAGLDRDEARRAAAAHLPECPAAGMTAAARRVAVSRLRNR